MNKEQLIDEIDWLIFEMKPGLEVTPEHLDSFMTLGINFNYKIVPRAAVNTIVSDLKVRREKLL